jgi:hypothetical protein
VRRCTERPVSQYVGSEGCAEPVSRHVGGALRPGPQKAVAVLAPHADEGSGAGQVAEQAVRYVAVAAKTLARGSADFKA